MNNDLNILLEKNLTKDNLKNILELLSHEYLLLPMDDNRVIFLGNDSTNDTYIPLFTNEDQIKDLEYTCLDKVKISKIIDEIYDTGKFRAISINPYTHDFVLSDDLIELIRNKYKVDKLEEIEKYCNELFKTINLNNYSIDINVSNHKDIPKLKDNKMGIYIYIYGSKYLKIGKAWTNSDARWIYQHYNFKSSSSNLASSIKNDEKFCKKNNIKLDSLDEKKQVNEIKNFIKNKVKRINIIIDRKNNQDDYFLLNLLEAWLHYKCKPVYEGIDSERGSVLK